MKKTNWIILVLILTGILAIFAYNFVYQEHRNIESEATAFSSNADVFVSEFQEDATVAESKYLNKTVLITGVISEINSSNLTLNDAVFCSFSSENNLKEIKPNTKISIKGRCIGYDELLEQVKLDQCTVSQ
ncbi:hypothetical protein [Lacinutrix sp. Hel_I_90]|uniref:OB-fold protein n=1 Tax=Lacinutrix sp. Hel_I_90 TaxID=1249999 RepID=UPI0005CAC4AE|nr:hypothetical protein [Lacinutrix sp. Hel_I_90]